MIGTRGRRNPTTHYNIRDEIISKQDACHGQAHADANNQDHTPDGMQRNDHAETKTHRTMETKIAPS